MGKKHEAESRVESLLYALLCHALLLKMPSKQTNTNVNVEAAAVEMKRSVLFEVKRKAEDRSRICTRVMIADKKIRSLLVKVSAFAASGPLERRTKSFT